MGAELRGGGIKLWEKLLYKHFLSNYHSNWIQRRRWNFLKKRFKYWHENRVNISHDVKVSNPQCISMDSRAFVGNNCLLGAGEGGEINIGKDVQIAFHTFLLTSNHEFDKLDVPIYDQPMRFAPITIKDDVWIGCRCMILAGVTVGEHAVVAAHTVLSKDVPPWAVVGGNPARVIKYRKPMTDDEMKKYSDKRYVKMRN
jgi:maltose O-acetyltransferase